MVPGKWYLVNVKKLPASDEEGLGIIDFSS
ncbi:hypothetical protein AHMF7616_01269 [Adhaeribacter pallidiroseus]|uniref:Uncharacterized protein n=1 Tax=Adhaeribacter pallidiroseus TaxID=2072847 RepID=A0A369QGK0_9BACT|nr:hypothetical protein AHMF7616_01269 [Adhaeribacter pallidiroseus]